MHPFVGLGKQTKGIWDVYSVRSENGVRVTGTLQRPMRITYGLVPRRRSSQLRNDYGNYYYFFVCN